MRNFVRDGGGSIRMYGILNALAIKGHEVVFISNAKEKTKFHTGIIHLPINYEFSSIQKSIFQGILAVVPVTVVYIFYKSLFTRIKTSFNKVDLNQGKIIFFEYLDNSIAYVLKKKHIIPHYINDIHGIATMEFDMAIKNAKNIKTKMLYFFKYRLSKKLDCKIFNNGDAYIFASGKMKTFYEKIIYHTPKSYIIPNLLDDTMTRQVDIELRAKLLNQFQIFSDTFVFLFAGHYKFTSGIEDLICAFERLHADNKKTKLILICREITKILPEIKDSILYIDGIPYEQLFTYQSLAHVIVCPDRMNPYSNMIVHIKYFDALASGKLVINGSFDSVNEINKDDW
jgi:glycosyltransferase involved in cell wall biosynthesis